MKINILFYLTLLCSALAYTADDVYVKGYTKSNGTYVAPHYRSAPDSTINNNWSTEGNVNPYTGKEGYIPREHYQNGSVSNAFNDLSEAADAYRNSTYSTEENDSDNVLIQFLVIVFTAWIFISLLYTRINDARVLYKTNKKSFYLNLSWMSCATLFVIFMILTS